MLNSGLHHDEEPIVAHASGQGSAAIAILRFSGRACHDALLACLKRKNPQKVWQMNFMTLCEFYDPRTHIGIDEVMVVFTRAPHSYTGQDTAEIYFHGSPYILQTALSIFYTLGFRHAEPGEFTRRAFLSGKMDLSEAEGIHELISASSQQQWLAARQLYTGKLKDLVDSLFFQLKEAIAWLEASIDFPEEDDTSQITQGQIRSRVDKVRKILDDLLASYQSGRVASQGLAVAIFGEPNVGKSTLLNTLLNAERAIVTEFPGTTRDYLEEACLINGRLIRLIDTAGVRKGKEVEKIEQMGIDRTFALAKTADLVIFLVENPLQKVSQEKVNKWIQELAPPSYLKVLSKSDLKVPIAEAEGWLRISCHSGEGLNTLKEKIQKISDQVLLPLSDQPFISSVRHKQAVENALRGITSFLKASDEGAYPEILAFELQQTAKCLVSIIGEFTTEEILDIVFGSFCVGK